eukprot:TRINITY_DN9671_c0_g4_i1.p1 TRINITY_DN9671_c0_g4~~TRINITY_DN9671_c0_g4_i1.p1  ORF type:complete len:174 (+),score=21.08 TRINITY_DN9671_c0_g4_i1:121-642(+)
MQMLASAVCSCCVKRDNQEYQMMGGGGSSSSSARPSLGPWQGGRDSSRQLHPSQVALHQRTASSLSDSGPYARQGLEGVGGGHGTGPCIVCKKVPANSICLPCGHLLVCFGCSLRYQMPNGVLHPDTCCPCCNQQVQSFQRIYMQTQAVALSGALQPAEARRWGMSAPPRGSI